MSVVSPFCWFEPKFLCFYRLPVIASKLFWSLCLCSIWHFWEWKPFRNNQRNIGPLMNCCWVVWWTLQSSNSSIVQCDWDDCLSKQTRWKEYYRNTRWFRPLKFAVSRQTLTTILETAAIQVRGKPFKRFWCGRLCESFVVVLPGTYLLLDVLNGSKQKRQNPWEKKGCSEILKIK